MKNNFSLIFFIVSVMLGALITANYDGTINMEIFVYFLIAVVSLFIFSNLIIAKLSGLKFSEIAENDFYNYFPPIVVVLTCPLDMLINSLSEYSLIINMIISLEFIIALKLLTQKKEIEKAFSNSKILNKICTVDVGRSLLIMSVIILLFFIIYRINDEFLNYHAERQIWTAMIAKNFFINDKPNLFYPEVNSISITSDAPVSYMGGIEIQFIPFFSALLAKIFGFQNFVLRILPAICSILSVYVFYRMVNDFVSKDNARIASIIFILAPMFLFLTHAFMPETLNLLLQLASVYLLLYMIKRPAILNYIIFFCLTILTLLSKPGYFYILGVLIGAVIILKTNLRIKAMVFFAVIFALVASSLYYTTSLNYAEEINGNAISPSSQLYSTYLGWGNVLLDKNTYFMPFYSITVFLISGFGVIFSIYYLINLRIGKIKIDRYQKLILWWLICVFIYFFVFAQANIGNTYYQIGFLPPLAIITAAGINQLANKNKCLILLCIAMILLHSIPISYQLYEYRSSSLELKEIGSLIKNTTSKEQLFFFAKSGPTPKAGLADPIPLFYSERQGWIIGSELRNQKSFSKLLTEKKPSIYVSSNETPEFLDYLKENYKIITEYEDYTFFSINNTS